MAVDEKDLIVGLLISRKSDVYTRNMDVIIPANVLQSKKRDELRKELKEELHKALDKILKPEVINTLLNL